MKYNCINEENAVSDMIKLEISRLLYPFIIILFLICFGCEKEIRIFPGMTISETVTFAQDSIFLDENKTINIEGSNIMVDFNHSVLIGSKKLDKPDQFEKLAIRIKNGSSITIKNLKTRGFKIALIAEGVDDLQIIDSDLSYNTRLKKFAKTGPKFTFLKNTDDLFWYEHLHPGVAIYLKDCQRTVLKNLRITGSQNGVLLSNCSDGLIYNNEINFNVAVGIGLYKSNRNRIMHNRLDWNTASGMQTSGGLFFFRESSENEVNFNSMTHCGNESLFFDDLNNEEVLEGNFSNRILQNDFSYTPKYELIQTFEGGNHFENNIKEGCTITIVEDEILADQFTPPLADGKFPFLEKETLQGCSYILPDDYGPYNYKYPSIWLRSVDDSEKYTFAIFGPPGNWKAIGGEGFKAMSRKRGAIPATLVLHAEEGAKKHSIQLEYLGPGFYDVFGQWQKKGKSLILDWTR